MKKLITVPKYKTLPNGSLMKVGYRAYSVITDKDGNIINSKLKKEK